MFVFTSEEIHHCVFGPPRLIKTHIIVNLKSNFDVIENTAAGRAVEEDGEENNHIAVL